MERKWNANKNSKLKKNKIININIILQILYHLEFNQISINKNIFLIKLKNLNKISLNYIVFIINMFKYKKKTLNIKTAKLKNCKNLILTDKLIIKIIMIENYFNDNYTNIINIIKLSKIFNGKNKFNLINFNY